MRGNTSADPDPVDPWLQTMTLFAISRGKQLYIPLRNIDICVLRSNKFRQDPGATFFVSGTNEQGQRAAIRQVAIDMKLNIVMATKHELEVLKDSNVIGKRAPCAGLLTLEEAEAFLRAFGYPHVAVAVRTKALAIKMLDLTESPLVPCLTVPSLYIDEIFDPTVPPPWGVLNARTATDRAREGHLEVCNAVSAHRRRQEETASPLGGAVGEEEEGLDAELHALQSGTGAQERKEGGGASGDGRGQGNGQDTGASAGGSSNGNTTASSAGGGAAVDAGSMQGDLSQDSSSSSQAPATDGQPSGADNGIPQPPVCATVSLEQALSVIGPEAYPEVIAPQVEPMQLPMGGDAVGNGNFPSGMENSGSGPGRTHPARSMAELMQWYVRKFRNLLPENLNQDPFRTLHEPDYYNRTQECEGLRLMRAMQAQTELDGASGEDTGIRETIADSEKVVVPGQELYPSSLPMSISEASGKSQIFPNVMDSGVPPGLSDSSPWPGSDMKDDNGSLGDRDSQSRHEVGGLRREESTAGTQPLLPLQPTASMRAVLPPRAMGRSESFMSQDVHADMNHGLSDGQGAGMKAFAGLPGIKEESAGAVSPYTTESGTMGIKQEFSENMKIPGSPLLSHRPPSRAVEVAASTSSRNTHAQQFPTIISSSSSSSAFMPTHSAPASASVSASTTPTTTPLSSSMLVPMPTSTHPHTPKRRLAPTEVRTPLARAAAQSLLILPPTPSSHTPRKHIQSTHHATAPPVDTRLQSEACNPFDIKFVFLKPAAVLAYHLDPPSSRKGANAVKKSGNTLSQSTKEEKGSHTGPSPRPPSTRKRKQTPEKSMNFPDRYGYSYDEESGYSNMLAAVVGDDLAPLHSDHRQPSGRHATQRRRGTRDAAEEVDSDAPDLYRHLLSAQQDFNLPGISIVRGFPEGPLSGGVSFVHNMLSEANNGDARGGSGSLEGDLNLYTTYTPRQHGATPASGVGTLGSGMVGAHEGEEGGFGMNMAMGIGTSAGLGMGGDGGMLASQDMDGNGLNTGMGTGLGISGGKGMGKGVAANAALLAAAAADGGDVNGTSVASGGGAGGRKSRKSKADTAADKDTIAKKSPIRRTRGRRPEGGYAAMLQGKSYRETGLTGTRLSATDYPLVAAKVSNYHHNTRQCYNVPEPPVQIEEKTSKRRRRRAEVLGDAGGEDEGYTPSSSPLSGSLPGDGTGHGQAGRLSLAPMGGMSRVDADTLQQMHLFPAHSGDIPGANTGEILISPDYSGNADFSGFPRIAVTKLGQVPMSAGGNIGFTMANPPGSGKFSQNQENEIPGGSLLGTGMLSGMGSDAHITLPRASGAPYLSNRPAAHVPPVHVGVDLMRMSGDMTESFPTTGHYAPPSYAAVAGAGVDERHAGAGVSGALGRGSPRTAGMASGVGVAADGTGHGAGVGLNVGIGAGASGGVGAGTYRSPLLRGSSLGTGSHMGTGMGMGGGVTSPYRGVATSHLSPDLPHRHTYANVAADMGAGMGISGQSALPTSIFGHPFGMGAASGDMLGSLMLPSTTTSGLTFHSPPTRYSSLATTSISPALAHPRQPQTGYGVSGAHGEADNGFAMPLRLRPLETRSPPGNKMRASYDEKTDSGFDISRSPTISRSTVHMLPPDPLSRFTSSSSPTLASQSLSFTTSDTHPRTLASQRSGSFHDSLSASLSGSLSPSLAPSQLHTQTQTQSQSQGWGHQRSRSGLRGGGTCIGAGMGLNRSVGTGAGADAVPVTSMGSGSGAATASMSSIGGSASDATICRSTGTGTGGALEMSAVGVGNALSLRPPQWLSPPFAQRTLGLAVSTAAISAASSSTFSSATSRPNASDAVGSTGTRADENISPLMRLRGIFPGSFNGGLNNLSNLNACTGRGGTSKGSTGASENSLTDR